MNLIIELNNFHEEVLYGEYCNNNNSIILTSLKNYEKGLFNKIASEKKIELSISKNIFILVYQLISIIKKYNISTITFITCERKFEQIIFILTKFFFINRRFHRYSHNIPISIYSLLKSPIELFIILLCNKNYVIDDRVKLKVLSYKFCYREVFYGLYKNVLDLNFPANFNFSNEDIYITIIGTISFKRRNYKSLQTEISKINNPNVKFIFLTNYKSDDGLEFYQEIQNSQFRDRFVFFDFYLSYSEFCKIIDISQASALLFDHSVPLMNDYANNKVSSAVKFSEEFNKILLVSDEFKLKLKSKIIYYKGSYISEAINMLF